MSERQPHRRVTLKDVAARAGVSISTASLVYSRKHAVSEATTARVVAAAADLGYVGPDPLASSLRQGRSGVVGVHVDGTLGYAFQDPYAVSVLDGLGQALEDMGVGMLLISEPPGGGERAARIAATQAMDAFVFALCGAAENPIADQLAARGVPMVGTGAPLHPAAAQVRIDDHGATVVLVDHLLALGHRRIGHLAMPLGATRRVGPLTPADLARAAYPDTADRLRAFLERAGHDQPMAEPGSLSIDGAVEAAALLLDRPDRPTAIVAQSDLMACGVIRAANDRGLRVPDDLSVVGFDGIETPWISGTLTTADQDGPGKGRRIGTMVQRLLDGEQVADESHPVTFRLGTTTAPPQS